MTAKMPTTLDPPVGLCKSTGHVPVALSMRVLFEAITVADMAVVIADRPRDAPTEDDVLRVLDELDAMSDGEASRLLASDVGEGRRNG